MNHRPARAFAARLLAATARWWRRSMVARARDVSASLPAGPLMVLAPHPDDETFGCGALIARTRAAGLPVTIVIVSDGRHSTRSDVLSPDRLAELRAAELRVAVGHLGVPRSDLVMLGWEDGSLAGDPARLTGQFARLIAKHQPTMVLAPCAQDGHPDHRSVSDAAVRAVLVQPEPCLLVAYPVWAWVHAPWFIGAPGTVEWGRRLVWSARQLVLGDWVRVGCDRYLAAKRAAVAAYASQTTNLTGEEKWSHLSPEFSSLFLQPAEIFQRVLDHPGSYCRRMADRRSIRV
jgi:LmbE family N-acetylglucosaminyl deacetylase